MTHTTFYSLHHFRSSSIYRVTEIHISTTSRKKEKLGQQNGKITGKWASSEGIRVGSKWHLWRSLPIQFLPQVFVFFIIIIFHYLIYLTCWNRKYNIIAFSYIWWSYLVYLDWCFFDRKNLIRVLMIGESILGLNLMVQGNSWWGCEVKDSVLWYLPLWSSQCPKWKRQLQVSYGSWV